MSKCIFDNYKQYLGIKHCHTDVTSCSISFICVCVSDECLYYLLMLVMLEICDVIVKMMRDSCVECCCMMCVVCAFCLCCVGHHPSVVLLFFEDQKICNASHCHRPFRTTFQLIHILVKMVCTLLSCVYMHFSSVLLS